MGLDYTCKNCKVKFISSELQRNHYKSDWHHYNLKRRVVDLPPLSAEDFCQRVIQTRAAESNALLEESTCFYCQACRKQFTSLKTHENHLNSKKHKENLLSFGENKEVTIKHYMALNKFDSMSTITSNSTDVASLNDAISTLNINDDTTKLSQFNANDCLFCNQKSENLEQNLEHMLDIHGFYIPDVQYCLDIVALIMYLSNKISNHYLCLRCNDYGKIYASMEAVRKHMIDKGHCYLIPEEMSYDEYKQFYDYDKLVKLDKCAISSETDSEYCIYEMILPSGTIVGNRSFLRYYKQNLRSNDSMIVAQNTKKYISKCPIVNQCRIENDESRRRRDTDLKLQLNFLSARLRP